MPRWHAPNEGVYKLNTDAAVDLENNCFGLSMVIKNHLGMVMACSSQKVVRLVSPYVAEAMTTLKGIIFVTDTGLQPVNIELDALNVVNLIKSDLQVATDVGLVICDIKDRLNKMGCIAVVFVPRLANVVVYNLSKLMLAYDDDYYWMESYPPSVERFVRDNHLV
ncbi:hypothetical protein Dsin_027979 [Dipteronia sinensis]|uniref:RNase H type-1 domain-containing protein n=1 Tax=Dipteronia sinensis TaxID=43782 RepID=A0AAD9ZPT0_9ROSI|nr:hypothetical protein Dsin_027979 [Dipteronia sinensis]